MSQEGRAVKSLVKWFSNTHVLPVSTLYATLKFCICLNLQFYNKRQPHSYFISYLKRYYFFSTFFLYIFNISCKSLTNCIIRVASSDLLRTCKWFFSLVNISQLHHRYVLFGALVRLHLCGTTCKQN